MNVKPKKTVEEMREYKRDWARNNTGLQGRPKDARNQNSDKTHCVNGHEFTEENTKIKIQDGVEHRNCRECLRQWAKERARKDHFDPMRWERLRARRRKGQLKRVGWTPELFDKIWKEQEGQCAVCRKEISKDVESIRNDKAQADHEHTNPPIPRGILCVNCNLGLGNLQENIEIMEAMIAYVKKHTQEG
jgi:hypothetical protein